MALAVKNQAEILQKLGIEALNPMQLAMEEAAAEHNEIILLSPTGTGKTLAFLLPMMAQLKPEIDAIQALILVPSRELAIQIEQVLREMGSGFKANAVYGGRSGHKDRSELKHAPAILIGTPGRVADHMRSETISTKHIATLILDEFDKSLETGFEKEMTEIIDALPSLEKKILTSATQKVKVPDFVGLHDPFEVNFLQKKTNLLEVKTILTDDENKLKSLLKLLEYLGDKRGILFCNFKIDLQSVSNFLDRSDVAHATFFGGMEQLDRERALIQFRNGTHRLLVATDLAARGIDVPELDYIIHYQLPPRPDEFTHRNGRTARMNSLGEAYVLRWKDEPMPVFIKGYQLFRIPEASPHNNSPWTTLHVSGGRKHKISKGDIAGLFFKQGGLVKEQLGIIELKQDCAYVAVPKKKAKRLISELDNSKLKTKKVRITPLVKERSMDWNFGKTKD